MIQELYRGYTITARPVRSAGGKWSVIEKADWDRLYSLGAHTFYPAYADRFTVKADA